MKFSPEGPRSAPSRRDVLRAGLRAAIAAAVASMPGRGGVAAEESHPEQSIPEDFIEQMTVGDPLDSFLEPLRRVEKRGEFLYMSEDAEAFLSALGGEVEVTPAGEMFFKSPARGINKDGKDVLVGPEKEGEKHIFDAAGEGEILVVRAGKSGRELAFVFYSPEGAQRVVVVTERVIKRGEDGPIHFDEYHANTLIRPEMLPQENQGGDMPPWHGDM